MSRKWQLVHEKEMFWFPNVEQERAQNKPALLLQFVKL